MSNVEKIQLFLNGKLDPQETVAFQKKIQEDADLKKEVEDYRSIFQGLKNIKRENFAEQVKEWNKSLPALEVPEEKTFSLMPMLKRAVAALVLIGLFGILYQTFQSQQALVEFAEAQYLPLISATNRSQATSAQSNYTIARSNFDLQKYEACIAQLNTIESTDTIYLKALFLQQHAFYKSQKHEEALQTFSSIQSIKTPEAYLEFDQENATWTALLSQAVLYQNTPSPKAKSQLLQELKNFLQDKPEEAYQTRVKELIALLD